MTPRARATYLTAALFTAVLAISAGSAGAQEPQPAPRPCYLVCASAPATPTPAPSSPTAAPSPASTPPPAATPAPTPPPAAAPASENDVSRLLALVNRHRASHGLRALRVDPALADIARGHSARMASQQELYHNDALFTRETHRRLGIATFGENVSVATSVDEIHQALLDSSDHHKNIDNPVYTVAGFALARGAAGGLWATEDFGSEPRGRVVAAPAAAPRPVTARVVARPAPPATTASTPAVTRASATRRTTAVPVAPRAASVDAPAAWAGADREAILAAPAAPAVVLRADVAAGGRGYGAYPGLAGGLTGVAAASWLGLRLRRRHRVARSA